MNYDKIISIMDLSKVVLINYIDKVRIDDSDPSVTVQRLVRYASEHTEKFNDPSFGETEKALEKKTRVLSLTRHHWKIFDKLTEDMDVCPGVLFGAVERYRKIKPCGFDQAFEVCLDMIWQTFDFEESSANSDKKDSAIVSDNEQASSSTIH
jgi:hypothetical protein